MTKLLFSFFLIVNLHLTIPSIAQSIQASVDFAQFQRTREINLLDIYLEIESKSLEFVKNENNRLQAKALLTIYLEDIDGIKYADKLEVSSAELADSILLRPNLFIVKSFFVKKGDYTLNIQIRDLNNKKDGLQTAIPIRIEVADSLKISDIVFLSAYEKTNENNDYVKNGYKMIPKHSQFFTKKQNEAKFYLEIYNLDKKFQPNERLLFSFKIQDANNYRIFSGISGFNKLSPEAVQPILKEFSIEKLPSGNFNLLVEIRDSTNQLIYKKTKFFQRSSDLTLEDINKDIEQKDINNISIVGTFVENVPDSVIKFQSRALRPMATKKENIMLDMLIKGNDYDLMRRYMLYFWEKRPNPNAETGYKDFVVRLAIAERQYSTKTFRSFETDRGRVFIQYGAPNRIDNELNQYRRTAMYNSSPIPYETWNYFNIPQTPSHVAQTNRLFVFVEDNRGNNAWRLVHSNALGEISNEGWQNQAAPNNVNEYALPVDRSIKE